MAEEKPIIKIPTYHDTFKFTCSISCGCSSSCISSSFGCIKQFVRKCFNDELYMAYMTFVLILFDWGTDVGTGIYHFTEGNWLQGFLTFSIVFIGGLFVTLIQKLCGTEDYIVDGLNGFWKLLVYFPSFAPFYSGFVRIKRAKEIVRLKELAANNIKYEKESLKAEKDFEHFKDIACWDAWAETVYEAGPQAVLQIVLLLQRSEPLIGFWDWLPVFSTVFSIIGITTAPRNAVLVWDVLYSDGDRKKRWTMFSLPTLTIYCCKATELMWTSMMFVLIAALFPSSSALSIFITFLIIAVLIDVPYLVIESWLGRSYRTEIPTHFEEFNWQKMWLQRFYIFMDLLYVAISPLPLLIWCSIDVEFLASTKGIALCSIYFVLLFFTITSLIFHSDRTLVGVCFPYFMGILYSRIISSIMRKKYPNAKHGYQFHVYI